MHSSEPMNYAIHSKSVLHASGHRHRDNDNTQHHPGTKKAKQQTGIEHTQKKKQAPHSNRLNNLNIFPTLLFAFTHPTLGPVFEYCLHAHGPHTLESIVRTPDVHVQHPGFCVQHLTIMLEKSRHIFVFVAVVLHVSWDSTRIPAIVSGQTRIGILSTS